MKLIKLHARTQDLKVSALYINPEQITAINSTPSGTLVQVASLAYMVRESIPEVYAAITGQALLETAQ